MRALRVIGLSEDGKSVICEDVARSERFVVPADERLRAAARGDVTRLGQIEIELESQMRPREIQTRIRAGESVEQVAAAAGVPAHRVERFAYPVLLERSRTAELAQRAHPVREDGPDLQTLAEVAAHAFGLRGQDYSTATWDSWRGDDGKWVVQLRWHTGRSDNRAHWAFHPGAHGGTVIPLDDHAHDLMDPNPANRPLRTVRPVTELARQALEAAPLVREEAVFDEEPLIRQREPMLPVMPAVREPEPEPLREPEPEPEILAADEIVPTPASHEQRRHTQEPEVVEPEPELAPTPEPVVAHVDEVEEAEIVEPEPEPVVAVAPAKPAPVKSAPVKPVVPVLAEPEPVVEPEPEPVVAPEPVPEPAPAAVAELAPVEEPVAEVVPEPEPEPAPAPKSAPPTPPRKTEPAAKRGKKNHPIVPSWEDVLLGVRTQRG